MPRTVRSLDLQRPLMWPTKDANEVADYSIDFTDRLGGETISSATFSLTTAAGLVIDSSEHDSYRTATVTLSAGTAGQKGKVQCRIVTSGGQTLDETVGLLIRAR